MLVRAGYVLVMVALLLAVAANAGRHSLERESGRAEHAAVLALPHAEVADDPLRVLIDRGLEDQISIATLDEITRVGSPTARRQAWGVLSRKTIYWPPVRAAFDRLATGRSTDTLQALIAGLADASFDDLVPSPTIPRRPTIEPRQKPRRADVTDEGHASQLATVQRLTAAMNSGSQAKRASAVAILARLTASLFEDLESPSLRDDTLGVLIDMGLEDQIPIATLGEITADGSPAAQRRAWGVLSRKDIFNGHERAAFASFAKGPSNSAGKDLNGQVEKNSLRESLPFPLLPASVILSRPEPSRRSEKRARRSANELLADPNKQVESIPEWIQLLDGADARSRELAAHALADFGPKASSAVPALTRHLADQSDLVRLYSVYALASIGPAAREAVPALQQAAKSNDPAVRSAATHALAKIVPSTKRK